MTFDFICPWCLIGKRNLDNALWQFAAARPDVSVQVRWRGVQLLSHLPIEGVPFTEFYLQRLGSEGAVRARQAQVMEAARQAGVELALDRIEVMPNTANAHRLLAGALSKGSTGQLDNLLERLFAAHFRLGANIGRQDVLLSLAESCGYEPEPLQALLRDEAVPYFGLHAESASFGVPGFLINGRLAQVGAQPVDWLLAALHGAVEGRQAAMERRA
ncbi:DSBA-like thioredoxin domain protein [compost metagenome]